MDARIQRAAAVVGRVADPAEAGEVAMVFGRRGGAGLFVLTLKLGRISRRAGASVAGPGGAVVSRRSLLISHVIPLIPFPGAAGANATSGRVDASPLAISVPDGALVAGSAHHLETKARRATTSRKKRASTGRFTRQCSSLPESIPDNAELDGAPSGDCICRRGRPLRWRTEGGWMR